jgi:hypothetical protein
MRSHRLRIPGRHAYHEHRARIGLPEHGRSILARRVIRRRPFCVICLEPCGVEPTISRTASQSIVAAISVRAVRAQRCHTDAARRESVPTSRPRRPLHSGRWTCSGQSSSARSDDPVTANLCQQEPKSAPRSGSESAPFRGLPPASLVRRSSRRRRRVPASRHSADRRVTPAAGAGQALLLSFSPSPVSLGVLIGVGDLVRGDAQRPRP